jgi:hypothetical protein
MTKTIAPAESGYRPCACRDCFEIAIGEPGAYCHECDDAGCPGYQGQPGMSQECQAPGAYGGDDSGCGGYDHGSRIAELCRTEGAYPIAVLTDGPAVIVVRLLDVLRELAPTAVAAVPVMSSDALDAMGDGSHPAWDGGAAEELLRALMAALNAHAPEGFLVMLDGESVGFYPLKHEGR